MELVKDNADNNFRIAYKDCTNSMGASVETLIKVYQKGNSRPKYSINLCHTQSKIMVNTLVNVKAPEVTTTTWSWLSSALESAEKVKKSTPVVIMISV